jgi:hypothetical protein
MKIQACLFLAALFALVRLPVMAQTNQCPFQDSGLPVETRVEDLLSRLTLAEKISILHADSNLKLVLGEAGVPAEFEIKNTGALTGAEVAQLYVHPEKPGVLRPEKELKSFKKISLKPGEAETVSIPLDRKAFAFYAPARKGWVAEPGSFKILVGGSARDLPLQADYRLAETAFQKD